MCYCAAVKFRSVLRQGTFVLVTVLLFVASMPAYAQSTSKAVTLNEVIDILSLKSPDARIEALQYNNVCLQFENYKKAFLPSASLSFNPISFNRSLRLLQNSTDGSYSYVEDYSNNSSAGITLRQKVKLTGGELSVSSSINYLKEFSNRRNSFSTTPFSIGYSQQLWGGGKKNRMERKIQHAKNTIAIKEYCAKLSKIQLQALDFYMSALLGKMEQDFLRQAMQNADTLLQVGRIKLANGHITEYDLKQVELQAVNARYSYEKACRSYMEAQDRMAVFLGTERLEVTIPEFDVPPVIEANTAMHYVKENNPFSKQLEIQALEAARDLYHAKLDSRLNGNISLNYGVNKYASSFIEAYRHVNTRQSIVVSFQIPVFQWGIKRNRLKIAQNNYETSCIELEKKQLEFESEIIEAINSYNHSVRLWHAAEKAYHLSRDQYTMMIKKFALGKVSVYELTAAQDEQINSMQRYYCAIRDTYKSYFILRDMTLYDFKKNTELEKILIRN